MNILLIGNGFDLAHGLPTKYDDFLDFIKVISQIIEGNIIEPNSSLELKEWMNLNVEIKCKLVNNMRTQIGYINFWKDLIIDNIWFDYFFENRETINENWIDFEKEISFVISNLDEYINQKAKFSLTDNSFSGFIKTQAVNMLIG